MCICRVSQESMDLMEHQELQERRWVMMTFMLMHAIQNSFHLYLVHCMHIQFLWCNFTFLLIKMRIVLWLKSMILKLFNDETWRRIWDFAVCLTGRPRSARSHWCQRNCGNSSELISAFVYVLVCVCFSWNDSQSCCCYSESYRKRFCLYSKYWICDLHEACGTDTNKL